MINRKGTLILRISKNSLLYVLLLLLYFRPAEYVVGSTIYRVGSILLIFEFAVLVFINLVRVKKPSLPILILLLLFFWCLIGSTVINALMGHAVSFNSAILFFATAGGYILLTDMGLTDDPKKFLGAFVFVGTAACLINAVSIFVYYPSGGMNAFMLETAGRDTYYFLAEDNATIFWTWSVLVVTWIYYFRYNRTTKMLIWAAVYSAVTFFSYYYVWSVLAMMSVLAMIVVVFYYRKAGTKGKKKKKIRFKRSAGKFNWYWILALIANYIIVVSQSWTNYVDLINTYLKKSATLSGRTRIWDRSIEWISKSPLIGYGQETLEASVEKLGINHTHNIMLETLFRGGIIAAVLFILFLLCLGNRSKKVNSSIYNFLMAAIFAFLLMCSIEFAFYRYPYLILFVLMIHTKLFENHEIFLKKEKNEIK